MPITLIYRSYTKNSTVGAIEDVFDYALSPIYKYTQDFVEKNPTCSLTQGRVDSKHLNGSISHWIYFEIDFESDILFNCYLAGEYNIKNQIEKLKENPEFIEFVNSHETEVDNVKIIRDMPRVKKSLSLN